MQDFELNLMGLNIILDNLEANTNKIKQNVQGSKSVFSNANNLINPISTITNSFESVLKDFSNIVRLIFNIIEKSSFKYHESSLIYCIWGFLRISNPLFLMYILLCI